MLFMAFRQKISAKILFWINSRSSWNSVSAIETVTEIYGKYLYSLLYPLFFFFMWCIEMSSQLINSSNKLAPYSILSLSLSLTLSPLSFFFLTSIAQDTSVGIMHMLWVRQLRGSDWIHSRVNRCGSSAALVHTIPRSAFILQMEQTVWQMQQLGRPLQLSKKPKVFISDWEIVTCFA